MLILLKNIHILKKYFTFRLKSKPRGGHDIHSPFVYDLYTKSIDIKAKEAIFERIEELRKELLKNDSSVSKNNFGSGTKENDISEPSISRVVKRSSIPPYMGQLLFRLTDYLKPESIIELGTSAGFSTMYLASGNKNANVVSIEGDVNLAKLASANFNKLGLTNVTLINGEFDAKLPDILASIEKIGLVFIDGNHSDEATLRYFKLFSAKACSNSLIIFDDIRWSKGMENAWNNICQDVNVSISIDMFNCGLVFFRKGIVKQHFNLRYGPF